MNSFSCLDDFIELISKTTDDGGFMGNKMDIFFMIMSKKRKKKKESVLQKEIYFVI